MKLEIHAGSSSSQYHLNQASLTEHHVTDKNINKKVCKEKKCCVAATKGIDVLCYYSLSRHPVFSLFVERVRCNYQTASYRAVNQYAVSQVPHSSFKLDNIGVIINTWQLLVMKSVYYTIFNRNSCGVNEKNWLKRKILTMFAIVYTSTLFSHQKELVIDMKIWNKYKIWSFCIQYVAKMHNFTYIVKWRVVNKLVK